MLVKFHGELRSVVKGKEFKRKDGSTGFDVSVNLESDGVPQYFTCDESLLARWNIGELKKGDMCEFVADYNPRWKFNQFVVKVAEIK